MTKNIFEYVNMHNKIGILLELYSDEKYINKKASDFELFDEWERCLYLAAGHSAVSEYAEELESLGLARLKFGEYSRAEACDRWKRIHSDGYEDEEKSACCEVSALEEADEPVTCFCEINIERDVSKYIINCENYKELLTRITRMDITEENRRSSVIVDISEMSYSRPDPHSAELLFEGIKSDEKYNIKNIQKLCVSILIELLLSEKINEIHIKAANNSECAGALLEYICERGFFRGEVFLEISSGFGIRELSKIAARVYPRIKITPTLNGFDRNAIENLVKHYPIGACIAGKDQDVDILYEVISSVSDSNEHTVALMNMLK